MAVHKLNPEVGTHIHPPLAYLHWVPYRPDLSREGDPV